MSVSQITPTLFLSGADAALNQALVARKGITLIINVTLSHACPVYPGVECVRVPVSDLPHARLGDHFERVAARIQGNCGGGTLVHCAVGLSRSPALVMAYLMKHKGLTLRQAHGRVRESRPGIRLNASFWDQLLDYEKRLYGKNTVRVAAPLEPIMPAMPNKHPWSLSCPPSLKLRPFRYGLETEIRASTRHCSKW
ncbi:dual specificity protein phosphatase 18 [Alosa sapidissima]|uniref:dual specificity protein phosphatase 18 n=1 Tax=Alosa sapidissima TaxID=34773 RepID=UPI001C082D98|nr:dual specificity protein phosphatase 18 [Alosa sapidissima]XP_041957744.1 dual specificity protein phosphatase 18 [Alosa sapidissima]